LRRDTICLLVNGTVRLGQLAQGGESCLHPWKN
jgi:hypothetical protein